MYMAVAVLRNGQTQLQWSRIQIFLVFNTVALPVVLGTGQPTAVKFALSAVGLAIHLVLLVAALRGNAWLTYWDERMAELERVDQEQETMDAPRVPVFSDTGFREKRHSRVASRWFFGPFGIIALIFWLEEVVRYCIFYFHG